MNGHNLDVVYFTFPADKQWYDCHNHINNLFCALFNYALDDIARKNAFRVRVNVR